MSWQSIDFTVAADRHEALCALLEAAGALAVTSLDAADQPVLEPGPGLTPLWPSVHVSALFDGDFNTAPLLALLTAGGVDDATCIQMADRAWARSGQDVAPRHFGGRLWVCPSGVAAPTPDAIVLQLDAGLAFGTGSHPTTALCLRWLAQYPPAGGEVIDYGCGSGILAIAAALLGACRVSATDIDPQALRACADNAARNGVGRQVQVQSPDELPAGADLLLANILAPVLVALAPRLLALLRPGGALLLSGLLEPQVADVVSAYAPAVTFTAPHVDQGWVCMDGIKH